MSITLEAEPRLDMGKGASRRLRRLEDKVPAILYGSDKKPVTIHLQHKEVVKALETESIYSSILELSLNGKSEQVILKDLQRHPYKPIILHMDFQRVSGKDVLVRMVPLHFMNEAKSPGVVEGGVVNHTMVQVEIRCQARYLPEFIEVDLSAMNLDDVLHLSDLKLPKNVELAIDPTEGDHDHPVVSIHKPKVVVEEETEVEASEEASEAEVRAEQEASSDGSEAKEAE